MSFSLAGSQGELLGRAETEVQERSAGEVLGRAQGEVSQGSPEGVQPSSAREMCQGKSKVTRKAFFLPSKPLHFNLCSG